MSRKYNSAIVQRRLDAERRLKGPTWLSKVGGSVRRLIDKPLTVIAWVLIIITFFVLGFGFGFLLVVVVVTVVHRLVAGHWLIEGHA